MTFVVFIARHVIKYQIEFEIVIDNDSNIYSFDITFFFKFRSHVLYIIKTYIYVEFAYNINFVLCIKIDIRFIEKSYVFSIFRL